MASRIFNKKQALEREVKDLYLKMSMGSVSAAASASLATSEPIVLTSVAAGPSRNTTTFTLEVAAAAANPTDTILADFTGTASAIVCTITPNDGTNNAATPVDLTTEELVELINSGAVVGKTVTVTDGSSLRALQTASGGDSTPLADSGEGDGEVATFGGGTYADPTLLSDWGIRSVVWNGVGDYTITLEDTYYELKHFRGIILKSSAIDARFQIKSQAVSTSTSRSIRFLILQGATPIDLTANEVVFMKMELKNSGV